MRQCLTCRSLKPAQHAGQTLMRCKQDQLSQRPPEGLDPSRESSPGQASRDRMLAASTPSTHSSTSGGAGDAGRSSRSLPQSAQGRGSGELVSYPLTESPEQSGPGPPARASTSEASQGSNAPPWAISAALSSSPDSKGPPDSLDASAKDPEAHQGSARAGPWSGSGVAGDVTMPDTEDLAESSSMEGTSSSVRGQHTESGVPAKAHGPVMRSVIRIDSVEWHSRIEKDWYAATVFVDLLTFIYVAVFYQVHHPSHRLLLAVTCTTQDACQFTC